RVPVVNASDDQPRVVDGESLTVFVTRDRPKIMRHASAVNEDGERDKRVIRTGFYLVRVRLSDDLAGVVNAEGIDGWPSEGAKGPKYPVLPQECHKAGTAICAGPAHDFSGVVDCVGFGVLGEGGLARYDKKHCDG